MRDSEKSREELLEELERARARIALLEAGEAERQADREAYLREQAFSETLLSSLPGIFYLYTYPELLLVRWNTNHETHLGFTSDELRNRSIMEWHPPKLRELVREAVERVMAFGHQTIESPLVAKDGRMIPFLMTGARFEAQGRVYLMGVGIDISERERAEKALRESEARVRLVLESAPDAIFIQSEGRFAFPNRAALSLFGARAPEELVGTLIMDRIHPESREKVRERIQVVNENRSRLPAIEERYLRLDGTVVDVEVAGVPFVYEGKPAGLVFVRDITERKRAERVMVHNERMMTVGGLAAGMAHEINNPLGGILQSLQNIKRRLSPGLAANEDAAGAEGCSFSAMENYLKARQIPEFLDAIEECGKRAARIVANMLEFSRGGASGRVLVDVNELAERAVNLVAAEQGNRPGAGRAKIAMERDFDPERPGVPCIPSQIEQVLVNLLQNATQALEHGTGKAPPARIVIRTRGEAEAVRIEVEDNGPGMAPGVLKRAFDPFFTTKPVGKGTGLGLSVSYFIVTNNHGGSIAAESRPGQGARFTVRLPRHP